MSDQGDRLERRAGPRVVRRQARALRRDATAAERILWERLRNRKLEGHKVRRQHPIGSFVADFCVVEQRLVIEVDGTIHAEQVEHDAERSSIFAAAGYRVIRFTNVQVEHDLEQVLDELRSALSQTA